MLLFKSAKNNSILFMFLFLGVIFLCSYPIVSQTSKEDLENEIRGLEIKEIIQQIKEALNEVVENSPTGFPFKLKTVKLDFEVSIITEEKGGINLWLIKIGGGFKKENASKICIQLEPPPTPQIEPLAVPEFKSLLAQAIHSAEVGLTNASRTQPKLLLKELNIKLKFVVGKTLGVNPKFTLLPVDIDDQYENESVHNIELVFTGNE